MKQFIYRIKRIYHFFTTALLQGFPALIKYSFPANRLKIIAITGTDGKTTSSTLVYQILKQAGKKVGLISTVAAFIGDEALDTGFHVTNPEPADLQKYLKQMVTKKMEYVVLEFTSHGAYQHRLAGIKPMLAGLTNISHEHFDYQLNIENYIEAKAQFLRKSPVVVLNRDDMSFSKVKKYLAKGTKLLSYSQEDELPTVIKSAINHRFPEQYNRMNARLAVAITTQLEIAPADIAQGIANFTGVPGRMQWIPNKRGIQVVVDFAHTPEALTQALTSLRAKVQSGIKGAKLIAVFGCAGLRDASKRPMMGKAGVELADLVVFTAEDPRTEDIWVIIRQMKEQLTSGHEKINTVIDRSLAIDFAINRLAKKGDIVGIFGKGPEKSMCYGHTEYPWSDQGAVLRALNREPPQQINYNQS